MVWFFRIHAVSYTHLDVYKRQAYEDKLSMEYLPVKGEATTYSTSTVTDSAAAGTRCV